MDFAGQLISAALNSSHDMHFLSLDLAHQMAGTCSIRW